MSHEHVKHVPPALAVQNRCVSCRREQLVLEVIPQFVPLSYHLHAMLIIGRFRVDALTLSTGILTTIVLAGARAVSRLAAVRKMNIIDERDFGELTVLASVYIATAFSHLIGIL